MLLRETPSTSGQKAKTNPPRHNNGVMILIHID